jgi:FMN phosphatase YigB (HAD superfamily)
MLNDTKTDRIRYIAFDLWNTLAYSLPRDPLIDLAEILGIVSQDIYSLQRLLLTREFASSNSFFEICSLLNVSYCHQKKNKFYELIERERKLFNLFSDSLPVLKLAKEQKFRVILASNLWNFCLPVLNEKIFYNFTFDYIFYSFKVGHIKPDNFFFKAFESAKIKVSEVIFVGDSLGADVLGSMHAGAKAIWLRRECSSEAFQIEENYLLQSDSYLGSANNLYQSLDIIQSYSQSSDEIN